MKILIENIEDAKAAADAIFDYTDNNLSSMEAYDMEEEGIKLAKEMYERAKAYKETFK